jgi:uncharacterized tellurite resistance protein B-like protein
VDIEQRRKVCQLIEAVISADGEIVVEERELLDRVRRRFRLSEADVKSPADEGGAGEGAGDGPSSGLGRATTTLRELDQDVQTRVMALLVEAAVVDGRVDPEERVLLLAAAAALGIEATALEERIARRLASPTPGV